MEEAEQRKNKSIGALKAWGVPYLDSLPMIETSNEVEIRSKDAIIGRIWSLLICAEAAMLGDSKDANNEIGVRRLSQSLTPNEKAFLSGRAMSERDRINFSWGIEGVVPLVWALGVHDNLFFPDQTADMASFAIFWRGLTPQNIASHALRSKSEILDQADLIYRLHWATRQAELDGQAPPEDMDPGVVVERHRSFNWLIGYDGADWDDVGTDT